MKTVYLALGTNLGDRAANLRTAVERIGAAGVRVTKLSSVYETRPMYRTAQPLFLNMVVEGKTDVLPQVLLKRLLSIEREMGRRRTMENGPRVIDIDILFYGRFLIETPELTIPHPRMGERRFVMEPMVEIAPGWRHPGTKSKMREMLEGLPEQGVRVWTGGKAT
ncbi:MAG: 2-amino-4-hydroxy-6-hydroxymethyldihydropteridine diphosphokinase [Acidobacteria bacterium]|nr:2-amino-4-hydroxy-6-hydroxymethyldihydropteridine diphosphokinase [Acidobacteriota bacterium]